MRSSLVSLAVVAMLASGRPCGAEDDVRRFEIASKATGARYVIEVVVPSGAPANGSRYPAVYCTDWFVLSNYLRSLPGLLEMGRLAEPFVFVGISQQGGSAEWALARTRDFTPARPEDAYSKGNTYPGALEVAGGSARFVAFLREELIPRVESTYPVDPARRGFLGYSLGGLLGVQILAREPQLFHDYLIGSPSVWFNDYVLGRELESATARSRSGIRRLYLSVGEEESWEMLKGYALVRDALARGGLDGPRLKAEVIAGAGHVGGMPISLYNGLRFLYRRK